MAANTTAPNTAAATRNSTMRVSSTVVNTER
jgi:hypothetical protein